MFFPAEKMMFNHCVKTIFLFGTFLSVSHSYSIGMISSGIPVSEFSDNHSIMKRAVSANPETPVPRVRMGASPAVCDSPTDGIEIDWDGSPANYTCYHPKNRLPVFDNIEAVEECLPEELTFVKQVCLNDTIDYEDPVPTHGRFRRLFAAFGEYTFVPPQRWVHNLEHGAIVMLYHPCTEPRQVNKLRKIVKGCLRKHVITPYTNLPVDKPLTLVAWGCKLQMNHVNEEVVKTFIKTRALKGPETYVMNEGKYRYKLLQLATPPKGSNMKDENLCPSS